MRALSARGGELGQVGIGQAEPMELLLDAADGSLVASHRGLGRLELGFANVEFLTRKWARELDYRLIKELWAVEGNRIAVRFAYEWRDDSGQWYRSYGNENWEFDEAGYMAKRYASINDKPIAESERKYFWPAGRRPDDHPGLSDLGL